MSLTGIIAIAGKPGLYKVIARSKTGLVVESLVDGKKMPALATHKISALEDISMYTTEDDVKLSVVFNTIYELTEGKETLDPKSSGADLFEFFGKVLPNFDQERVYASDLKKLFTWFNILLKAGVVDGKLEDATPAAEATEEAAEEVVEEVKEK